MKAVSKLVVAAVLAAVLPGARALADDDCRHDHAALPAPAPYAPVYAPAGRPVPVRHDRWRERELRELEHEFRLLDRERAAFHQRWGWNGRKARKFERYYAARRAELERRWNELQYYAWR